MKVANLSQTALWDSLNQAALCLRCGAFTIRLKSNLPELAPLLWRMYASYPLVDEEFADFHIHLLNHHRWRRWWRPQIQLWVDDECPFEPFPRDTTLPFLEWGLNWCVASRVNHYLMLHAGMVERNNLTLLLPAHPASGKSTLCAALCHRGWRLLTDEAALVRPADLAMVPFPRLIPLKNESIAVFRDFAPDAVMGPEYPKTRKGTVCHVRPPTDSIERDQELAKPRWIVFPKYRKGAAVNLRSVEKTEAFVTLSGHSFNYDLIGLRGFQTLANLIDACDCYAFEYGGNLEQAVTQLNALADGLS